MYLLALRAGNCLFPAAQDQLTVTDGFALTLRPVEQLSGNKDLAFLENKWLVWKFTVSLEYNTISAHTPAAHSPWDHRQGSNASQGSAANSLLL